MAHEHAHADASDPFQRRVAIAMAVYAVLLAFTTMLTNQARTEALLLASHASDQWAYYQAKSTKGVVVKAEAEILGTLAPRISETVSAPSASKPGEKGSAPIASIRERLEKDGERYEKEKEEIQEEANKIVAEGEQEKRKEHWFEYAATVVELSIIMATVGLLLESRPAFYGSMAMAGGSVVLTCITALT